MFILQSYTQAHEAKFARRLFNENPTWKKLRPTNVKTILEKEVAITGKINCGIHEYVAQRKKVYWMWHG
jgi:hypothetical protein